MGRKVVSAAATVLLLASCGGSDGTVASSPTATASSSAPTGVVDIGGGKHLYAECAGTGSPTIVLESGDEGDSGEWNRVFDALVAETRTCRYDRLGLGRSADATGCRQLADLNADLAVLLEKLGERGPYLLVGASGGGFLAAGFAYAHSESVAGMVFAETPRAIVPAEASAELLAELRCDNPQNAEHRDYVKVENDAWSARRRIGDIPLTVITNDYGDHGSNQEERTNVAGQKGWFVLSPQARQVIVTSGHDVADNEAQLVTTEILRVLAAARARATAS